jgi:nucleoside-diphosphate-sugar epimerase
MSHRVFVTGATGYLGNPIARRLLRAGNQVLGLTRSAQHGQRLSDAGIQPVFGDLADAETFLAELKNCDTLVHVALDHGDEGPRQDQNALEAMQLAVEDGRIRRVLYTSGIYVYGHRPGIVVDEDTPLDPATVSAWRPAHEQAVTALSAHDVTTVVLRPGVAYGGARGFIGEWFREARDRGTITYPGGDQHWCMVHIEDIADAYALALEHAPAGSTFLLVDESRHTVRELAHAAATAADARAVSMLPEIVREKQGASGEAKLGDLRGTSARARRELGWTPMHTSFISEAPALHREWTVLQGTRVG